ncbi:MAG: hypothetical protein WC570_04020 [Patescibacteria group bacterium]
MKYLLSNKYDSGACFDGMEMGLDLLVARDKQSGKSSISKSTQFHVENNDYLGTTATIIDLYLQTGNIDGLKKALKKIRDDLVHLQKNYKLVKKSQTN